MAITLTRNGVTTAVSLHPENTRRKAVSVHTRDLSQVRVNVHALGVELTIPQIVAQFQAHWTLLRKQAGGNAEGVWANDYSRKIVKETREILRAHGVSMTSPATVAKAK